MNSWWQEFAGHAASRPALVDGHGRSLTYGELRAEIDAVSDCFLDSGAQRVASFLPHDVDGVLQLLGALCAGVTLVPVAAFASPEQVAHLLDVVKPDLLLVSGDAAETGERSASLRVGGVDVTGFTARHHGAVRWCRRTAVTARATNAPALITFTSGSTGQPKGVCLDAETLDATCTALVEATDMRAEDRHVCLHPFAVLLELVGGLLRSLRAGATVHLPALTEGQVCCSDGPSLLHALRDADATSAILVPEMLAELVRELEAESSGDAGAHTGAHTGAARGLDALRFLGVGGAVVPEDLLRRSAALGLPVFQGYGATECGSVIALNGPRANRVGSVGRPLAHVHVEISDEGEILVGGRLFSGYFGEAPRAGDTMSDLWPTGDLGCLDEDGFLHVRGRKSNVFSTPLGRNVSAEWLEERLLSLDSVQQAVVFGEGFPGPVAVLVPWPGHEGDVRWDVERLNTSLPSYARIGRFHMAAEPLSEARGHWCATGRPRRAAILRDFETLLRSADPVVSR